MENPKEVLSTPTDQIIKTKQPIETTIHKTTINKSIY